MELLGLRVLVTGAAGFIGSHLSDRLSPDNELLLLDDFSVGRRENLAAIENCSSVRVVEADVRDRATMQELCRDIDVVFHLATSCLRTSLGDPTLSHDTNAGGTLNLCLGARDAGVRPDREVVGHLRPQAGVVPVERALVQVQHADDAGGALVA